MGGKVHKKTIFLIRNSYIQNILKLYYNYKNSNHPNKKMGKGLE